MAIIEERQITQARVVTQILTRASTTITTIVTLGNDPVITPVVPTPEVAAPAPPPVAPASSAPALTNEQLGAILGSVLGFLLVIVPLCYCCMRQPRRWPRRPFYSDDSSSDDDSERVVRVRGRSDPFWGMPPMRQPFTPVLVPPPPRIPPKRYAPYRQTRQPQISGVRVYP